MSKKYRYYKRENDQKEICILASFLEEEHNSEKCLALIQRWNIKPNEFDNNPFHMIQIEHDEFQEIGRIHNLFIYFDVSDYDGVDDLD